VWSGNLKQWAGLGPTRTVAPQKSEEYIQRMEEEKKYTFDRSPSRSSREGHRHISGRHTFMIMQTIDIWKLETERRDYCGNWRRQSDGRMKPRVQCPSCSLHHALSNAFPIILIHSLPHYLPRRHVASVCRAWSRLMLCPKAIKWNKSLAICFWQTVTHKLKCRTRTAQNSSV